MFALCLFCSKSFAWAYRAKIGLDIKDMFDKLNLNDMAGAKLIYDSVRFCVLRIFEFCDEIVLQESHLLFYTGLEF